MVDWGTTLAEADDELIKAALCSANIPSLLAALIHLSGDSSPLHRGVTPQTNPLAEEEDGLSELQREQARQIAFEAIVKFRNAGCTLPSAPSAADILETMHFVTGVPMPDDYVPLLREELSLFGEDGRAVDFDGDIPQNFRVLIIGAGMSGILAAIRLKQMGIPYLVVEKNSALAGTWHENTYPGCRVDSPNHLYSYMFAPKTDWPNYFSDRKSLFGYFTDVAQQHGIQESIRLNTKVDAARWDESEGLWRITVTSDGAAQELEAQVLISATGQLNVPKFPNIEGRESFSGPSFHSSRWEHDHDLAGKRVAVIGTGASATQFVPELVAQGAQVSLFQRTPPWVLPTPEYHAEVTPGQQWLFRELPFYARWFRFWLFRRDGADGILPFLYRDPQWEGSADTLSANHAAVRDALVEFLNEVLPNRQDLVAKITPAYPVGGKRPLRDDGLWLSTLAHENVNLVSDPVTSIDAQGVKTQNSEGGEHFPVDAIIYGTGFRAEQFLCTLDVEGKDGATLASQWGDDPRAYMGMTIPKFPNLFCIYGPNTNIVVGSSIVFFSECSVRYVMKMIKRMLGEGYQSVECREEVHAAYNEKIDAQNRNTAWGSPNVESWYKNAAGRVTQNWPGTHFEYWQQTLEPDEGDYIVHSDAKSQ